MTIQVDSREQRWEHVKSYMERNGVKLVRSKLYAGDYARLDNQTVCVDRKQNLQEIAGNLCQQHERFRAECVRARDAGIKLIILIEHGCSIKSIDDVRTWKNPRLKTSPNAPTGARLAAVMETMAEKYGVEWRFCCKQATGLQICKILEAVGK